MWLTDHAHRGQAGWLALSTLMVFALSSPGAENTLTVEQTLGAVLGGAGRGWQAFHAYRFGNKAANEVLWRVVDDINLRAFHVAAISQLGYTGDAADAKRLLTMVESLEGELTAAERDQLKACIVALGLMTGRSIPEADSALRRMCDPSYWIRSGIRWDPEEVIVKNPELRYEGACEAVLAYAAMGRKNARPMASAIFAETNPPPKRDGYVASRIGEKWLPNFVDTFEAAEHQPLMSDERERFLKFFEQMKHLLPKPDLASAGGQSATIRAAIKEAKEAYRDFVAAIQQGHDEKILATLLDDGRPIKPNSSQSARDRLVKDLAGQKEVFDALRLYKVEDRDVKVKIVTIYEMPRPPADDEPLSSGGEEITITWRLAGSGEVGSTDPRLSQQKGAFLTVASDGTLIVVMKRIQGKWYWNPFGW
jgi:hypothetical protein